MAYKNIEDKKRYNKKWDKEHRNLKRGYEKKWREKNPDKVKAQKDRYYEKNKEYIKQKSKLYYENIRKQYLKEHADEERIKNREKSQRKAKAKRELLCQLRQELGGKCSKCGYNEEPRILTFHHSNGNKIDNVTNLQTLEAIKAEAAKCILLCPNCHALIHLNQC